MNLKFCAKAYEVLGLAIARPAVCINFKWLYTRLRVELAVCRASAVYIKAWLLYEEDVDFRRPQYSQHSNLQL